MKSSKAAMELWGLMSRLIGHKGADILQRAKLPHNYFNRVVSMEM